MDPRVRSRALLWVVLASFACCGDDTGKLLVVVRVEPTVQVTTAFPAEILVGFDSSGSGFVVFQIGFLCAPPSAPAVFTATFSRLEGNASSAVDGWVIPVAPGAALTCGPLPEPRPVAPPPAAAPGAWTRAQTGLLIGCAAGDTRSVTLVVGGDAAPTRAATGSDEPS